MIAVPGLKTQMVRASVRAGDEFEILAYGDLAQQLAGIRSGTPIVVTASISAHGWCTADGKKHQTFTFTAESVQ